MTVEGKNILLYIKNDDGIWTATACAKNCTLSLKSEFLEITNPNTKGWREYVPNIKSWNIQGNGLVNYNREISATYFHNALINGLDVNVKFRAWQNGSLAIYSGKGYIKGTKQDAPVSGFSTFSYQIIGNGELTVHDNFDKNEDENKLIPVLGTNNNEYVSPHGEDLFKIK